MLYSDVNFNIGNVPVYELIYDRHSVRQSIMSILLTDTGSRVFRRDFGSKVTRMLFEPLTNDIVSNIIKEIETSVGKWEPRVDLKKISGSIDKENQNIEMSINYNIPSLGYDDNLAFVLQSRV